MECAWIVRILLFISAVSDHFGTGVEVQVRLFGGNSDYEGGLMMLYTGFWGLVCDDQWGINDAKVACRMLGFLGAESAIARSAFGDEPSDVILHRSRYLLDDVSCSGNEDSLLVCTHSGFWTHNCGRTSKTAGVVCTNNTVSLLNTESQWARQGGMVQVYASDAWRSVCSDTWNMDYGQALCRELLYPGLLQNLYRDSSGSEEPASIGNLTCKNNAEPTLSECSASVSPTGCPTGYAWVECQPAARFASSTNVSGAVEVYHDGQWRFMCYGSGDSAIRDANAKLACRMMGHPDSQVLGSGTLNTTGGFLGMSYTCTLPSSSSRDERDLRFCKSDQHDNCTMVLRIACASPSDPFDTSSDITASPSDSFDTSSSYILDSWHAWSDWSDVDATTTPSTSTVFLHDSTPRDVRISNRHFFEWS